jgi:tripartite-type tricarboxylate transporter receptor subunit TctC
MNGSVSMHNYLFLLIFFPALAVAQTFPTKSLRWVGIATPGTTSDIIGRAIGEPLSKRFG